MTIGTISHSTLRPQDLIPAFLDALREYAPDYCYFGAHEGDGADFGFWIDWEQIASDARDEELLLTDDIGARGLHLGPVMVSNDHGNATLYAGKDPADADDQILWSVV